MSSKSYRDILKSAKQGKNNDMLMFINEVKSCESFPSMRKDVITPVAILRQELANFEKKIETMTAVAMDSDPNDCSASANKQWIAPSF